MEANGKEGGKLAAVVKSELNVECHLHIVQAIGYSICGKKKLLLIVIATDLSAIFSSQCFAETTPHLSEEDSETEHTLIQQLIYLFCCSLTDQTS